MRDIPFLTTNYLFYACLLCVWYIDGQFRDGRTVRTLGFGVYKIWALHYRKLPVGYSKRYHPVVSTYRILLCFSYLLTQNRDWKGLWRTYAEKWNKWYYTALRLIPSDLGPCSIRSSHYGWAEDTWEYWKQHDFEQLIMFVEIHHIIHRDGPEKAWRTYASQLFFTWPF